MRKIQSHKSASNVHNSWRKRENRKSCLHKLSDIGLRLICGSPTVRICAQIWRSLLNLQQGTNVFQCADFWAGDFLMFEFCIFGFWEFEDFGREKWGWRPVSKKGRRLSVAWRWKLDSTIFYSACWLQCPFSCKASWQWQMSSDPLMIIYLIKQSILSSWTTITETAI